MKEPPRFANEAERECAKVLDFYGVPWEYEPRTFVLEEDEDGRVDRGLPPDFFLPEQNLYLEITVMKQRAGDAQEPQAAQAARALPGREREALLQAGHRAAGPALPARSGVIGRLTPASARSSSRPRSWTSRVGELGADIARDYAGRDLLLVSLLKASFVFLTDLSRAIPIAHAIDFVELAGYNGADTGGHSRVRLLKDTAIPVTGHDVLLVEDVVDTG